MFYTLDSFWIYQGAWERVTLVISSIVVDLELVGKLEDLYFLPIYMYAPSSFGMKNKQYYLMVWKNTCVTKLQSPTTITTIFHWTTTFYIIYLHIFSCNWMSWVDDWTIPNFLQGFIKCHFISAPFIKHKPLRPQISQQTFVTHKVHSW
jgi:hypothetical protein